MAETRKFMADGYTTGLKPLNTYSRLLMADTTKAYFAEVYYNKTFTLYYYDHSSTAATSIPSAIRPSNYSGSGVWIQCLSALDSSYSIPSTVNPGMLYGGGIESTSGTNITMKAFWALDETTLSTQIYSGSSNIVDVSSFGAGDLVHLFACKNSDGTYNHKADTSSTGANLSGVSAKHKDCFCPLDSSGNAESAVMTGGTLHLLKQGGVTIATTPSVTPFLPTYSDVLDTTRAGMIGLWGKATTTSSFTVFSYPDGVNAARGFKIDGSGSRSSYGSGSPLMVRKNEKIGGLSGNNAGTVGVVSVEILGRGC
jgi:hypothetical protein